jgi:acetyltransferase
MDHHLSAAQRVVESTPGSPEFAGPQAGIPPEAVVVGGVPLLVRPIHAGDDERLLDFFDRLSPRSIYMRFFGPMKQLSPAMLDQLTRVDPERHIALVALSQRDNGQSMLGVGRVVTLNNSKQAEFSIVVADAWQGLGIGANLLQRCIDIAERRGIERVWGLVLAENTQMLALGRKLGFTIERAGGAEFELTIDLAAAAPVAERTV